jgi:MYXO-CTERM domain-containing protein
MDGVYWTKATGSAAGVTSGSGASLTIAAGAVAVVVVAGLLVMRRRKPKRA